VIGDADERALLAAARRGLSPTTADQARVRRATAAALAGGGAAPKAGGPAPARAWPWAARLAVVGAVAAVAAGLGYRAGLRAPRVPPPLEHPAPIGSPTASSPAAARSAVPTAPSPAALPPARETEVTRPAARRRSVVEGITVPAASSDSLAEEVRALRAVERALREGNPGFALALLRELDRAVPNGQLVEERLATRTIARCASGDVPIGVDLADDFAARHPDSVYGRRVADACATDSHPSGDSDGRRKYP
jgi:hypothetical protein